MQSNAKRKAPKINARVPSEVTISVDDAIDWLVAGYRASLEDDAELVRDELAEQTNTRIGIDHDDDNLIVATMVRAAFLPPELIGYDPAISNALFSLDGKKVLLVDSTDDSRKSGTLKHHKGKPTASTFKLMGSRGKEIAEFNVMEVCGVYGKEITLKPDVSVEQEDADLQKAREEAADAALADFECEGFQEADGWNVDGNNWSCTYYYTDPDDPDGDSLCSSFGVEFVPGSSEIAGRWC